jgi:phosphoadenosine phosphosulfate reductase
MRAPADRSTKHRSPEALRAIAARGDIDLAGAGAEDLISWAATEFGDSIVATQSMVNAALSTLIAEIAPGIPVVFVDTGYHFAETLDTLERVRTQTGLTIVSVSSRLSVDEQSAQFGPDLWSRDPDLCCSIRKVQPLEEVLAGHDAWLTGLRRGEGGIRREVRPITYDANRNVVKISPMLDWSDADLVAFTAKHAVEVNPLLDQGFPSIGCRPCTRPVAPGENSRAGRWSGFGKTECGIHQ